MSLEELFEYAYSLKTPDSGCRNCESFTCQDTCEPGKTNAHGENLLLLPGEQEFIAERLGEPTKWVQHNNVGDVSVGFVPPGTSCPYWENGKCQIFEHRPIRCRSYPMLASKEGEHTMRVWSAQQCPKSMSEVKAGSIDKHHSAWIGIWRSLLSTVPDKWWNMSKRLLPGGCKLLFDYVDIESIENKNFSDATIKIAADPNCNSCSGEGFDKETNNICRCVVKHIQSEISSQPDTIFN